ncbi:MAG: hypothetical protein HZB46_03080, partial [Solirubrobacterales bacterium]|nr:hypothetical protein [Solirubrobacterales bacterium]
MASQSAHEAGGGRRQAHTREQVLHGIRRWHALYGEPPTTADWNPSIARWRAQEWRVARYRAGDPETGAPWPSLNACKRAFGGSFAAAVRAAGLVPHGPGPRAAPGPVRSSGTLTGTIPGNVALDAEVDALRTRIARLEAQLADSRQRARRMSD